MIGIDPVPNVARYEDHSHALVRWAKMGVRDAVLLHIDAHDDSRYVPPDRMKELEDLYLRRAWKAMEEAEVKEGKWLYNVGNFVYAAAKLGIVREIYWVIPFAHFSYPETAGRLKIFLRRYAFPESDVNTFRMRGKCFVGTLDGIPFNVCGVEALPEIDEPLLLSFDLDFLPAAAFEYGRDKSSALQMMFDALFEKKYRIRDAVVSYSVNGGYMPVTGKWLGDEAAKVIENPQYRGSPLWTALQKADIAYKQKRLGKSMNEIMPFLGRLMDHPAALVYIAYAALETDRYDDAFKHAVQACRKDKGYCFALVEMGYTLANGNKTDLAEKFYTRGFELRPDMNHRLVEAALFFRQRKNYKMSLDLLFRHRKMNDVYPVDFVIGETYVITGERQKAKKFFDSALREAQNNPYVTSDNVKYVDAIQAAYRFYKEEGDDESASALRTNAKLASAFRG